MLLKSEPGTNHTEFTFSYSIAENSFFGGYATEKNAAGFYPIKCSDSLICPKLKLLLVSFKKHFADWEKIPCN